MLTTAKQIAKYFQDSVLFDFNKETVSSLSQIQFPRDPSKVNFFTLTDRDAFCALLHDCLSYDNQLQDIFVDFFDSGLGLHRFASPDARKSPRTIVTYFLSQPKFQYHKNDVAKVYLAVNTWLVFFGAQEITPEWDVCPFCGGSIKSGKCVKCKKANAEFKKASEELTIILADEQSGKETPTPSYWKDIVDGSEFYLEYKVQIELLRKGRKNEVLLIAEKAKKTAVDKADKQLNLIKGALALEMAKAEPNLERFLKEITDSADIKEALKFADDGFTKRLAEVKDQISKKQKEIEDRQKADLKEKEIEDTVMEFLRHLSALEKDMTANTRPFKDVKETFLKLEQNYTKLNGFIKSGAKKCDGALLESVTRYEKTVRALASGFIYTTEEKNKLDEKQKKLIETVNLILNMFNGVKPIDDKGKDITLRFNTDVESNHSYDDFRIKRKQEYEEVVKPVKKALAKLISEENEHKMSDFSKQSDELLKDISNQDPSGYKSATFDVRLKNIEGNAFYASIRSNGEYKRAIIKIKESIQALIQKEKKHTAERQKERENAEKRKKGIIITAIVTAISLVALSITALILEIAGVTPFSIAFAPVIQTFDGVNDGGEVTITGVKGDSAIEKNLKIPSSARPNWSFGEGKITAIGEHAFENSSAIETVILPSTVEKIESKAFANCQNLRRVTLLSTLPPQISKDSFESSNVTFYVPVDNYEAYLQDEDWSKFSDRIFPNFVSDEVSVSVLFNSDGGSKVDDVLSHPINSVLTALPTPAKYGYIFMGWYYQAGEETLKFEGGKTLLTESLKLTAKWDLGAYRLTFDYNGGEEAEESKGVYYQGTYGSLPNTNKKGYTFGGWFVDGKAITEDDLFTGSSDVLAIASWTPIAYRVIFVYNGGVETTHEKAVDYETAYGELPQPQQTGFIFDGWYLDDVKITPDTICHSNYNHKLMAKWSPISYTVAYHTEGGFYDLSESVCYYCESYDIFSPTKAGYTFEYWDCNGVKYYAGDKLCNLTSVNGEVIVLTAVWTANGNLLTFDKNGGVGSMQPLSVKTGDAVTLAENGFTKLGYTFLGWSTTPGGEVEYYDQATFVMGANSTFVLYAVWQADEHVARFNKVVGGKVEEQVVKNLVTDQVFTFESLFTRDGYTFVGWARQMNSLSAEYGVGDTYKTPANDLVFYAVWKANKNEIIFRNNGASGEEFSLYGNTDSLLTLPACDFTKDGYTFKGWSANKNAVEPEYTAGGNYKIATQSEQFLYAIWQANGNEIKLVRLINGEATQTQTVVVPTDEIYVFESLYERDGYVLRGWSLEPDGEISYRNHQSLTVTQSMMVYSVWEARANVLRFVSGLGTGYDYYKKVYSDEEIILPESKWTKTGYTFMGYSAEDGKPVADYKVGDTFKTGVADESNIYAVWQKDVYNVVYNLNGGANDHLNPTEYSVDTPDVVFANPTRAGYDFVGWYLEEDFITQSQGIELGSVGDKVFYAKWQAKENQLTYNKLIGENVESSQVVTASTDQNLTLNHRFSREGYTLLGWATSASGTLVYTVDQQIVMPAQNLDLYSVWQANENVLTLLAEGIGQVEIKINTDQTKVLPVNNFEKLGYEFIGWAVASDKNAVVYSDGDEYKMGVQFQNYLYAVWERIDYEIFYALNGGINDALNPNIYTIDSPLITLSEPTRAGYTFVGWHTDEGCTNLSGQIESGSVGALYFYAKWQANQNSLKFDANGGQGQMDDLVIPTDGSAYLPMNQFTKTGYTFVGWKTTADEDQLESYLDGDIYQMGKESEYTLYAVWALNNYLIVYELYGGANDLSNPENYTLLSGDITLNSPVREGYTFGGWYTDSAFTNQIAVISSGSYGGLVLHAKWTANQKQIIFNANGGSGEMQPITAYTGQTVALTPNAFEKTGYVFMGWAKESGESASYPDGGNYEVGLGDGYTLYAVWKIITYQVRFVLNGGSFGHYVMSHYQYYTYSEIDVNLSTPTRNGYDFDGWYLTPALSGEKTFTIPAYTTGNYTVYAKWIAKTITITYDSNGADGEIAPREVAVGATITLDKNVLSHPLNYKFAGWGTNKNSASYGDEARFTAGASSVTLYAIWVQTAFAITYNLDGGTNSTANPTGYNTEGLTINLVNPVKKGHTFLGWYTESAYTNKITQIETGSTGDYELHAKWLVNDYKVTLDANGGDCSVYDFNQAYGTTYDTLATLTIEKTGYTFLGWYLGGSELITESSTMQEDYSHTLRAKWEANVYTVSFNFNGGQNVSGSPTSVQVAYNERYSLLPTPQKVGYDFNGWFLDEALITTSTVLKTAKDHILVAKYTAQRYDVTFNYNGATTTYDAKITVTYGQPYGTLPALTKTGHDGVWQFGGVTITASTVVTQTANHTLIAKWTVKTYTLKTSASNCSFTVYNGSNKAISSGSQVKFGEKLTYSTPSANSGFQNARYTSSNPSTMPANNLTISATADAIPPSGNSCFVRGTQIMLENGEWQAVEKLSVGDEILSFNHLTGEYEVTAIGYKLRAYDKCKTVTLDFGGGIKLGIVNGHGLFDLTLSRYVLITPQNALEYVGHEFVYAIYDGEKTVNKAVTLLSAEVDERYIERYDLVTEGNLNQVANGLLVCSDTLVGACNVFDFDGVNYDLEKMQEDIVAYGVFIYEEWSEFVSREEFEAFNGGYFKIAIAKGLMTTDELYSIINDFRVWVG